ncbi:hypothetical protein J7K93_00120 [bacterium]|nr:hypothetical protein [bacterium]
MNTKLTLRLDEDVIIGIKNYAVKHRLSVSKLTENIFRKLLDSTQNYTQDLTPIVQKYKGIVTNKKINEDDNLIESLTEKHS